MSPTCVKKLTSNKSLQLALIVALAGGVALGSTQASAAPASKKGAQLEAPIPGVVTVSDYEFNAFVFPNAIKRILFPAGSPVVGKPVYMQDNHQALLQFSKGHSKPIQMVVELDDGSVVSFRVQPKAVPGITHAVNGAKTGGRAAARRVVEGEQPVNASPRGEDIELLKVIASTGSAPDGFDPISLPAPTRFDKFTVVPLAGWSDGMSKRAMVFSLVAASGETAVVTPPQFYRPGITAVVIDGDVVDASNSPQLFVVEELSDE